ncbi:purine-nucleoside phosphorylase [Desulfobacterales bacterium HSG16]|nr:purine-nucleoside phosphorylase [Desulfobacterales bacterium HSG16]
MKRELPVNKRKVMNTMDLNTKKVLETAAFIKERVPVCPKLGFFTGTGLGESASSLDVSAIFDYKDLPNFPLSTVQSHAGRMMSGTLCSCPMVVMQGRFHLYEGYSPAEVTFPVRVMQELGVEILIISNAAGGFDPSFQPGDIMVIQDHVNLTGENPLVGPNEDRWGVRFPDMSCVYDPKLSSIVEAAGQKDGIALQKGVYAGLKGPSLETPAEIRYLKTIGADAVGFSTVLEVIAAVHGSMRVLGLSIITNVHNPDQPEPASVDEIIETAQKAAPKLETLINHLIKELD